GASRQAIRPGATAANVTRVTLGSGTEKQHDLILVIDYRRGRFCHRLRLPHLCIAPDRSLRAEGSVGPTCVDAAGHDPQTAAWRGARTVREPGFVLHSELSWPRSNRTRRAGSGG